MAVVSILRGNLRGPRGYSIATASIRPDGHLQLVLTDGTIRDAGMVQGERGFPGLNGTNGLDGVNGVANDTATAGQISNPASLTYAALLARFAAAPITALAGVLLTIFGHSFGTDNSGSDKETSPLYRLAARHFMRSIVNNAVGGSLMSDIQAKIAAAWVPNVRGLVGFADGCVNDRNTFGDDAGATTTREAFRTSLAYLTASAVQNLATLAFGFSTAWASGVSSTVGASFNFAFTGPVAHLLVGFTTDAGATLEIYNGTTLVRTVSTGGYKRAFTGAVKISGLGSGTHQLTGKLISGTVAIVGLAIMGDTPPLVLWDNAGNGTGGAAAGARLALYQDTCATVLPDFPTVLRSPVGSGWDPATMLGDSLHRNERGNAYAFTQIEATLRAYLGTNFQQGLNGLTRTTASTPYVTAVAPPGATVYAYDDFNRANSSTMGSTPVGGLLWQNACNGTPATTYGVFANTAVLNGNTSGAGAEAFVDTGQANGTVRATIVNPSGFPGLVFRASGTNNANGYVFFKNGSSYTLSSRTAGVLTPIASSTGVAPAGGDILEVVLNGSSIICKVNGAAVVSVTDTLYTGTRHGIFNNSAGGQHGAFYATAATS
jgi:hypothetical protein